MGLRWLSTFAISIQKWFYIQVIAAKSNILRNKLGICITLLSNSSLAKTWLSTRNSISSSTLIDTTSFESKEPRFRLLEIEANVVLYWHPKFSNELGFCRSQPRLVTYATEISLLRSLVASQQTKNSSFNIDVAHILPMLPADLWKFVFEIKAVFIGLSHHLFSILLIINAGLEILMLRSLSLNGVNSRI